MATKPMFRDQIEAYTGLTFEQSNIVRRMKDDYADGLQVGEIYEKYFDGHYGEKRPRTDVFNKLWRKLMHVMAYELPNPEDRVPVLHAMYMNLYRQAVAANNIKEARQILDSIAKLLGQTDNNTIEIKPDVIKISFGTTNKIEEDTSGD